MTARAVCRTKQQGITFVRRNKMDGSCLLCKVLRHLEFLHNKSNDKGKIKNEITLHTSNFIYLFITCLGSKTVFITLLSFHVGSSIVKKL